MDRRSFLQMAAGTAVAIGFPRAAFADSGHTRSTINNKRQIVLLIETTFIDATQGDRIVEVACVELIDQKRSGRIFYQCLNPERDVNDGAASLHGLTLERLRDEPKFAEISQALLEFISGAELVIHNAPYVVDFLNHELKYAGLPALADHCPNVIDTLRLAKELNLGMKNNLDALRDHYKIDITRRTLWKALPDADLLAEIYIAMTKVV